MSLSGRFFSWRFAGLFGFPIIASALGCLAVLAQPQHLPAKSLDHLARIVCETGKFRAGNIDLDTGFVAMLGVSERTYSLQVLDSGSQAMMIPAEHCGDTRPLAQKTSYFILSHSFQNRQRVRETYYYLMNHRGQLVNAVHYQEGRSHRFAFASPAIPVRRADFEAEKASWISKVSTLGAAQRVKPGAD